MILLVAPVRFCIYCKFFIAICMTRFKLVSEFSVVFTIDVQVALRERLFLNFLYSDRIPAFIPNFQVLRTVPKNIFSKYLLFYFYLEDKIRSELVLACIFLKTIKSNLSYFSRKLQNNEFVKIRKLLKSVDLFKHSFNCANIENSFIFSCIFILFLLYG